MGKTIRGSHSYRCGALVVQRFLPLVLKSLTFFARATTAAFSPTRQQHPSTLFLLAVQVFKSDTDIHVFDLLYSMLQDLQNSFSIKKILYCICFGLFLNGLNDEGDVALPRKQATTSATARLTCDTHRANS